MKNNRTTNNIFMRPLIIKLMIIISVVLMYFAFLYSFLLTIIPPVMTDNVDFIVKYGWYSFTMIDFVASLSGQQLKYQISSLAIGCFIVIAIAIVFNLLVVIWYRKANFSIGKKKKDILAVFTIPFIGMLFSLIVGLFAYPKELVETANLVPTYNSFMYEFKEFSIVDRHSFINMKLTTTGYIILAIDLLIIVFGVFSLVFFLFRILKKSRWNQSNSKDNNQSSEMIK